LASAALLFLEVLAILAIVVLLMLGQDEAGDG
jgi:hypothetical protein